MCNMLYYTPLGRAVSLKLLSENNFKPRIGFPQILFDYFIFNFFLIFENEFVEPMKDHLKHISATCILILLPERF